MARTFTTLAELRDAIGEDLGTSDAVLVDQERIDTFAEATGDHQWIHVDPARAADGPFGATVAHGYLTLSLVPALLATLVDYAGWAVRINYGSNKVRLPTAVRVGSRVAATATLTAVTETAAGVQVVARVVVTAAGQAGDKSAKPALVAELVTLLAAPVAVGGVATS